MGWDDNRNCCDNLAAMIALSKMDLLGTKRDLWSWFPPADDSYQGAAFYLEITFNSQYQRNEFLFLLNLFVGQNPQETLQAEG